MGQDVQRWSSCPSQHGNFDPKWDNVITHIMGTVTITVNKYSQHCASDNATKWKKQCYYNENC